MAVQVVRVACIALTFGTTEREISTAMAQLATVPIMPNRAVTSAADSIQRCGNPIAMHGLPDSVAAGKGVIGKRRGEPVGRIRGEVELAGNLLQAVIDLAGPRGDEGGNQQRHGHTDNGPTAANG